MPPVPKAERSRRIAAGACLAFAPAVAAHTFFTPISAVDSPWLNFGGALHPVVLHLPIGLVFAVLLRTAYGWVRRTETTEDLAWLWAATAVTATLATLSGNLLAGQGGFDTGLVARHRAAAGVFTATAWVATGFVLLRLPALASLGALAAAMISVVLTGHFGGTMVHGDPLAAAPWNRDTQRLEFLPPPGDPVEVFAQIVQPILQAKCVECHGPASRKGRLRADSLDALLSGGETGPALATGNADASLMIQMIELPPADHRHMPPRDKPQITADEHALLRWWIDQGASPRLAMARNGAPAVLRPFLVDSYRLLPDPEAEEARAAERLAQRQAEAARREALAARIARADPLVRDSFRFTAADSAELVFDSVSIRLELEDRHVRAAADLLAECAVLDFSQTRVSAGALSAIPFSESLRVLNLSQTGVDVAELANLADATRLRSLNLFATPVSPDWLDDTRNWPELETLYIAQTPLESAGFERLQRHFPQSRIILALSLPPAPDAKPQEDNDY